MTYFGFNNYVPGIVWSMVDKTLSLRERDDMSGETDKIALEMPQRFLLDTGTVNLGFVAFKPRFDLIVVPWGEELQEAPDGLDDKGKPLYQQVVQLMLYAPQFGGLRNWLATGSLLTRYLCSLLGKIEENEQAWQNMIPAINWTGVIPRKMNSGPGAGRTYYLPKLEVHGWIKRPEEIFGEREVALPTAPAPLPALEVQVGPNEFARLTVDKKSERDELNDEIPF